VPASTGLKFVVETEVLSIGTPSTMNRGSTDPFSVRTPRMRIEEPAPGSPADWLTTTFGAFPASACTTFGSFALTMSSAETALRTLPSFSTSVAVPAPVMTTSPSCSGFAASSKSCVIVPAVIARRMFIGR
jgi:hypothetical protein